MEPQRVSVEMMEYFGHVCLTLRRGSDWIRVNAAAETANRDLLEWLGRLFVWRADDDE